MRQTHVSVVIRVFQRDGWLLLLLELLLNQILCRLLQTFCANRFYAGQHLDAA